MPAAAAGSFPWLEVVMLLLFAVGCVVLYIDDVATRRRIQRAHWDL